jgi:hypothetical protein
MSSVVAVLVDGVLWQQLPVSDGHNAVGSRDNSWVVDDSSMNEVDQIVGLLSQVVKRAQSLSEPDQRRVRDFVHAAQAMLSATTYLPRSDQRLFEATLRDVAEKYG